MATSDDCSCWDGASVGVGVDVGVGIGVDFGNGAGVDTGAAMQ